MHVGLHPGQTFDQGHHVVAENRVVIPSFQNAEAPPPNLLSPQAPCGDLAIVIRSEGSTQSRS